MGALFTGASGWELVTPPHLTGPARADCPDISAPLHPYTSTQSYWAQNFGGTGYYSAASCAVDTLGNTYMCIFSRGSS